MPANSETPPAALVTTDLRLDPREDIRCFKERVQPEISENQSEAGQKVALFPALERRPQRPQIGLQPATVIDWPIRIKA